MMFRILLISLILSIVDCYDDNNQSTDINPDTDAFLVLDPSTESTTAPLPVQIELLTSKANVKEEITEETEETHHPTTDLNNGTGRVDTDTDDESATALTDAAEKDVPSSTVTPSVENTTFTLRHTSTTKQLSAAVTSSFPSVTETKNDVTYYNQTATKEAIPKTSTESLQANARPTGTETDNTSEQETKTTIYNVQNSSQLTTILEHTDSPPSTASDDNTTVAANPMSGEKPAGLDCNTMISIISFIIREEHGIHCMPCCPRIIVIISSVFATILLLISVGCLFGMWRIRKTWRQKLLEEKRKTDIWTMSTFDNTIVNENYFDINDTAFQDHAYLRQSKSSSSTSTSGTRKSSAATSGTRSSGISTETGATNFPFLRRKSANLSQKLPSKLFVGRAKSSYSPDALTVQDPDARGRASTFTHGRRKKVEHDTHNLVDHIETGEDPGILESVDNILKPQNKHIVTEL